MRSRRLWVVVGLVAVLAGGLGWLWFGTSSALEQVNVRRAELDRTEPGWRFDDLIAAYQAALPPADRNSIVVSGRAFGPLAAADKDWLRQGADDGWCNWLPVDAPNRRPLAAALADADRRLAGMSAALTIARGITDCPTGGEPGLRPSSGFDFLLPHADHSRLVCQLLLADAARLSLTGDPDAALAAVRAAHHLGRGLGTEPWLVCHVLRQRFSTLAARAAEHTLAHGTPTDPPLAALQAAFAADADAPHLAAAFRGERASLDRTFDQIRDGHGTLADVAEARNHNDRNPGVMGRGRAWLYRRTCDEDHLAGLALTDRAIELARRPPHLRPDPETDLPAGNSQGLRSRFVKVFAADRRGVAVLHTAAAGLACERFRLKHGRWPTSLAELGPVPTDPYDGQPLRFARTAAGAVVYSVGADGRDDGGTVSDKDDPGTDIGFRLFDPAVRGRPHPEDAP